MPTSASEINDISFEITPDAAPQSLPRALKKLELIRPGDVRVRLAPSPTGPLHVGTARTALFNFLFAKKFQGAFILRIEDTDKERSKLEYQKQILEGLKWLGLDWQEGPDVNGPFQPYLQSQRQIIYQKYIEKLINEEKVYYCFCSKQDLEAQRQYLMSIGKPPRYEGKCRELTKEQVKKNLEQKKDFVLRLKTEQQKIVFNDIIRGKIETDTDAFGDIVIAKSLNEPLYNLACVIDDFAMQITHIIRGEDHIPNTPKQILIAQALNITPPKYAHLPLILAEDKSKLSKRQGAISLIEYQKQGYLPETMINFLALLGWNPGANKEVFSLNSLVKEFSLEKVQKSGAVFNIRKLDWLNGFYLRNKSLDKLTELCLPYLIKKNLITPLGLESRGAAFEKLKKIIGLYQQRLKKLSEIGELVDYFFQDKLEFEKELLKWKEMTDKKIKQELDKSKKVLSKIKEGEWTKENIEKALIAAMDENDKGRLLWPLRVALTGKKASAGPFEVAEVLGKEICLDRIKQAKKKL